ncbi:hypothetical protein PHMEG_0003093 [Phytophthora megakarya]|uniref:Uncharacterized protein n=1 Tax=Phytophthora megakarya TaxID=4795 RepID=A0A225WYZ3_9STRA|nr:hypothetical protein PHMEG_0003093 [Phytophthora megakarya]
MRNKLQVHLPLIGTNSPNHFVSSSLLDASHAPSTHFQILRIRGTMKRRSRLVGECSDDDGDENDDHSSRAAQGEVEDSLSEAEDQGPFEGKRLCQYHENWEAWESKQKVSRSGTTSCVIQKRAKDGRSMRYLPDTVPRWRRRYICTYGYPERSRGKGDRPQQKHRGLQCPFRFTAESVYVKGSWKVEIRHPLYTQNHSLSKETFDNYSHNRQVPLGEPMVEDLRLMIQAGGRGSLRIYEYIRDHSAHKVTRRDVSNLMATIRKDLRDEADDDVAVAEFLLAFEDRDPGNVVSIDETSVGETVPSP